MEASIKQREEEVRAKKEEIEKDRRKERGVHMHEKAVENFLALLTDMVSWRQCFTMSRSSIIVIQTPLYRVVHFE